MQVLACGSLTLTNKYRPLVSHLRISGLSVSHSQRPPLPRLYPGWQYLTFRLKLADLPYANRGKKEMKQKQVYWNVCHVHFTACSGKHHSWPNLPIATTCTLTFDSGSPNSSCNCDCGASLVETEPFPGAKAGTLKWKLCPMPLRTIWLL